MFKSKRTAKTVTAVERPPQIPVRETSEAKQPAKSLLAFYSNRTSRDLSATERAAIEKAKAALLSRSDKSAK